MLSFWIYLIISFTAQSPSIFPNSPYQCTNNIRKNTNIYISPSGKESQHVFKPRWNITYTLCGLKKSKSCKINDWRLMSGATCASKPADPASDLLHTFPKSSIFISRNIFGEHFSLCNSPIATKYVFNNKLSVGVLSGAWQEQGC